MIIYSIEEMKNINKINYLKLFENFWPEKYDRQLQMINDGFIIYSINAKDGDKLIGTNGVLRLLEERDPGPFSKEHWAYFFTLVDPDYRNQGICNGILRMTTKFLIEMGAEKIRVDKSSLNTVKHSIFTDMGYKLLKYQAVKVEFKHTYELDVNKVDMNKLNKIWSEYVS